jgi:uncharacterized membrane protein
LAKLHLTLSEECNESSGFARFLEGTMQEEALTPDSTEITDDDRLWAALVWLPLSPLWPIIAIVALLMEDKKDRPFIRYHAVLSLVTGVVGIVLSFVCVGVIVILAMFYFAYQAYQGQLVEVPYLTKFAKEQGWL